MREGSRGEERGRRGGGEERNGEERRGVSVLGSLLS